ncbi:MAG: LppX_LprAFG lipoprotein [Chloroflexota bacterium]
MNHRYKPLNPIKTWVLPIFLLISLSLLLLACGSDATPTSLAPSPSSLTNALPTASVPSPTAVVPTPTTAPPTTTLALAATPVATTDPAVSEALRRAADPNGKINSLHFLVEVKAGKAEIRGAEFRQAEGDMKRPEDFQASIKVNSLFGTLSVEMLGINQEQFTTNPITGGWLKVNKDDNIKLGALLDPSLGVSAILLNLGNPKLIGPETINGVDTLHYQGTSTGKLISPLSIYTLGKHDVILDIWISTQDNLVRQINLKEIDGDAIWTISFSRFNETVTINRPDA